MASRLIIGYMDRVASAVSLSSTAADPAFPAANLATAQPGEIFRTNVGTTTAAILIDLGALVSLQAVFVGACNLSASGTWRVRLSTVDATGVAGNAYDSTTIAVGTMSEARILLVLPSAATGRYLLVNLTDSSRPYLEAGLLRALVVWNPARGYAFGSRRLFQDYSKVKKGPNGQQWPLLGPVQRGVQWTMPVISLAELTASGSPLVRWSGQSRDVLVCLDNAASDLGADTYFGLLEEVPAFERFAPNFYSTEFRLFDRI